MTTNAGDLSRVKVHEPSDEWPSLIEVVAYWSQVHGRRGRRRSIQINADQFFGRGEFGAPMSGEQLISMVNRLRQQGPSGQLRKGEFRASNKKAVDVIG